MRDIKWLESKNVLKYKVIWEIGRNIIFIKVIRF